MSVCKKLLKVLLQAVAAATDQQQQQFCCLPQLRSVLRTRCIWYFLRAMYLCLVLQSEPVADFLFRQLKRIEMIGF